MRTRLVIVIAIFFSITLTTSASKVYVSFDGGKITLEDVKGYIDLSTKTFIATGTILDSKNTYRDKAKLEQILRQLAFGRIATGLVKEEWLRNDSLFYPKFHLFLDNVRAEFLDLEYVLPKIKAAKEEYEKRLITYYEQNKDKEFSRGVKVKFRIIFFDTTKIKDEKIKTEKYQKALKVYQELKKRPERFVELAKAHSEVELERRGIVIGPYFLHSLDKNLSQSLEKLCPQEITPVVETKHGFIIARLEETEKEYYPFDEVKEKIIKRCGKFYGASIKRSFVNSLIGSNPKYIFYSERITSATTHLNDVVAEVAEVKLTNADILPFFYVDENFNDALRTKSYEYFKMFLKPELEKKLLISRAMKKGLFNNQRYKRLEKIAREYYIGKWLMDSLPTLTYKELKFLKESTDPQTALLEKYHFRIVAYPTVEELF